MPEFLTVLPLILPLCIFWCGQIAFAVLLRKTQKKWASVLVFVCAALAALGSFAGYLLAALPTEELLLLLLVTLGASCASYAIGGNRNGI